MKRYAAIAGLCLVLIGCRAPWTVRPVQGVEAASTSGQPFDAASFVESVWQSQAISAAAGAAEFLEWRTSGMTHPALVKGLGSVLRVDEPAQLLLLDLAPYDGKADVAVRVGEIHGTALRDALPFIQFSQFVNQVDFARASNSLNARSESAAQALGIGAVPGTMFQFGGVAIPPVDGGLPKIIPIVLSRENGQ